MSDFFKALSPLSWPYQFFMKARRNSYLYGKRRQIHLGVPVVSVGNLSMGGTGKSPTVIWLANLFERMGKRVVVLSRGYKSELENSKGLLQGEQRFRPGPLEYGDEPALIAKKAPKAAVIVGKDRVENFFTYAPQLQPDVVLLDDGLQHLRIFRDCEIVLFDARSQGRKLIPLPIGTLREPLQTLRYADFIFLSRADLATEQQKKELRQKLAPYTSYGVSLVDMTYRPTELISLDGQKVLKISDLKEKRVIAFAGLASPSAFFETLKNLGAILVDTQTFPDHHKYQENELKRLYESSEKEKAILITTEKDAEKMRRFLFYQNIYVLRVDISLETGFNIFESHFQTLFRLYEKFQS